jgi:glutathione S-transferase
MLVLYYRPSCFHSHFVLDTADALGLTLEKRDINDPALAAELEAKGGKRQIPYLVDTDRNVALYESTDIANYLIKEYGKL